MAVEPRQPSTLDPRRGCRRASGRAITATLARPGQLLPCPFARALVYPGADIRSHRHTTESDLVRLFNQNHRDRKCSYVKEQEAGAVVYRVLRLANVCATKRGKSIDASPYTLTGLASIRILPQEMASSGRALPGWDVEAP